MELVAGGSETGVASGFSLRRWNGAAAARPLPPDCSHPIGPPGPCRQIVYEALRITVDNVCPDLEIFSFTGQPSDGGLVWSPYRS